MATNDNDQDQEREPKRYQVQIHPGSLSSKVTEVLGERLRLPKEADQRILTLFSQGLDAQKEGRFEDAEQAYQQILELRPGLSLVHNNLGVLHHGQKHTDKALAHWLKALELQPDYADAHNNVGVVYLELDQPAKALEHFRTAMNAKGVPTVDVLRNIGVSLTQLKDYDKALKIFEKASLLEPDHPEITVNRAKILDKLKRRKEAIKLIERARRKHPEHLELLNYGAVLLRAAKRFDEARVLFDQLVERAPEFDWGWNNFGALMYDQRQYDEALEYFSKARQSSPDNTAFIGNVGSALRALGRFDEALACYNEIIERSPGGAIYRDRLHKTLSAAGKTEAQIAEFEADLDTRAKLAECLDSRARVFNEAGRMEEAEQDVRRALELDPKRGQSHFHLGVIHMARGEYQKGWHHYDWRWRCEDLPLTPRDFKQPEWDGRPLPGKTLLVFAEQGLGDSVQFMRFLPQVQARCGRVIFEHQKRLTGLIRDNLPVNVLVQKGAALPPFAERCAALSLPGVLGTEFDTVPMPYPYLFAPKDQKIDIGSRGVLTVGITWRGNPDHASDVKRSMRLEQLAPLFKIGGIKWISLQRDITDEEQAMPGVAGHLFHDPKLNESPQSTLATMAKLDLVITIDSFVAHLAGALGRHTWVLLHDVPDWRWKLEGDRSPWYANVRLIRQTRYRDWSNVIDDLVERLRHWVDGRGRLIAAMRDPRCQREYDHALALEHEGRGAEAENAYRAVLDYQPDLAPAAVNLAATLQRRGQLDEATGLLNGAESLDPNAPALHMNKARVHAAQGAHFEALMSFSRAAGFAPDDADVLGALACHLERMQRHVEAAHVWSRVKSLVPRQSGQRELASLALAYGNAHRFDAGCLAADELVQFEPRVLEHRELRAVLRLMAGRYRQAWEDLLWREVLSPGGAGAWPGPEPEWMGQPLDKGRLVVYFDRDMPSMMMGLPCLAEAIADAGPEATVTALFPRRYHALLSAAFPSVEPRDRLPPDTEVDARITPRGLLRLYRPSAASFKAHGPLSDPCSAGVSDTAPGVVRVGLSVIDSDRASWDEWAPVLGVGIDRCVDLSPLEDEAARSRAEREYGVAIHRPEGVNLDADWGGIARALDGVDVVVGAGGLVEQLAALLGKDVLVLLEPGVHRVWGGGWDHCPWFPSARLFRRRDGEDPGRPGERMLEVLRARLGTLSGESGESDDS
ncbi:MAG: tetratricopeptide repeat protein [Gammaproteobacteria bacterium]